MSTIAIKHFLNKYTSVYLFEILNCGAWSARDIMTYKFFFFYNQSTGEPYSLDVIIKGNLCVIESWFSFDVV